ncbi:hypothetical protein CRV02_04350 [Arcobacter sp. CECT 8989]|uniref:hypothetical protein n=1 Tax=Arcobacter sp. CECT 8989 TaxID=2044509 RepID=UPI00100BF452|nr:hypothetical protein [Arcobacter sp. CECT 8989]RXK02673.1 hypothetical protein CRV02_04350 [Arcobacter sp. CECT 8989]
MGFTTEEKNELAEIVKENNKQSKPFTITIILLLIAFSLDIGLELIKFKQQQKIENEKNDFLKNLEEYKFSIINKIELNNNKLTKDIEISKQKFNQDLVEIKNKISQKDFLKKDIYKSVKLTLDNQWDSIEKWIKIPNRIARLKLRFTGDSKKDIFILYNIHKEIQKSPELVAKSLDQVRSNMYIPNNLLIYNINIIRKMVDNLVIVEKKFNKYLDDNTLENGFNPAKIKKLNSILDEFTLLINNTSLLIKINNIKLLNEIMNSNNIIDLFNNINESEHKKYLKRREYDKK